MDSTLPARTHAAVTTTVPATVPLLDSGEPWVAPSWEEVVANHSAKVYRLAYRLTGNKYDAEDLTQEVFVRVFRSLANFKPGTLDGWLHRITTNLFLDQARRKTRIRFDALAEDAESRIPGHEPGPERTFEFNNLDLDVQAALDALPPDFRAAVVLCDLEGLSYDEVAQALDVKLGTVRSRIHRGRTMLRESLAHRAPGHSGALGEAPPKKPRLSLPRIMGAR
ncbi:RNA polymerase sigma factor SigE [Pseudarthrobacter sp. P1]|uniref:RNA polymerase sigma factor SigE n=1 Tax=Pseudarthrobacter sp. P1 TaxID=3418418 RepID=UPI003CF744CC